MHCFGIQLRGIRATTAVRAPDLASEALKNLQQRYVFESNNQYHAELMKLFKYFFQAVQAVSDKEVELKRTTQLFKLVLSLLNRPACVEAFVNATQARQAHVIAQKYLNIWIRDV